MRPEDFTSLKPDYPEAVQMKSAFAALLEISNCLNTHLSPESLRACVRLCELGIQPDVLAKVIKEVRSRVAERELEKRVQMERERNDGNRNI